MVPNSLAAVSGSGVWMPPHLGYSRWKAEIMNQPQRKNIMHQSFVVRDPTLPGKSGAINFSAKGPIL